MNITRTTNPIHFTDLEPHRFEQLAYELLNKIFKFKRLDIIGLKGNDGGVDLIGESNSGGKYYIQCKRNTSISKSDIQTIVDKIVKNYQVAQKSVLIYFFACDITAQAIQFAYEYAEAKGFSDVILYTSSKIEAELDNHKNILNKYFSLTVNNTLDDKIAQRKQNMENHKKFLKCFLRNLPNTNKVRMAIIKNPSLKFNANRFILRSVLDYDYDDPEKTDQPTWLYHNYIYDTLDKGIEFMSLTPPQKDIIINPLTKEWHFKTEDERAENNIICINKNSIRVIGLVPYYEIVEIEKDGDMTFNDPILHCKFSFNGTPFKEIYYKYEKDNIDMKENELVENLWRLNAY